MVTKEQARALVEAEVCRPVAEDDEIIVLNEDTIERPWGWVFFYTSKRWHETGDVSYAIAGNAPIIVERATGKLVVTGTAHPVEHYIEKYDRSGNPYG